MSNRFFVPPPLPFETKGINAFTPEGHPPADVVESDPPGRPGLYLHDDVWIPRQRPSSVDDHHGDASDFPVDLATDDYTIPNDHLNADDDARSEGPVNTDAYDGVRIPTSDLRRARRAQILQLDRFDRAARRARERREREQRRSRRPADIGPWSRRRSVAGSGDLESADERPDLPVAHLRHLDERRDFSNRGGQRQLSTRDRVSRSRGDGGVATHPDILRQRFAGPLQGTALAVYFVLLPYVVITRWNLAPRQSGGPVVHLLLSVLALFWVVFLVQLGLNVRGLHRGQRSSGGGSAWLAGLVVAVVPFLAPTTGIYPASSLAHHQAAAATGHPQRHASQRTVRSPGRPALPALTLGAVPLALMAKRRGDLLRQHQFTDVSPTDVNVDETIELLRVRDPELIARLRHLTGTRREGVLEVAADSDTTIETTSSDPMVVCYLGERGTGSLVSFAREGGCLRVDSSWASDELRRAVVALHDGRLIFADDYHELLRSLATRTVRTTIVIYLGDGSRLDEELRACAVTVGPYVASAISATGASGHRVSVAPPRDAPPGGVRVDLLRADPQVVGLREPLAPTLRRRCVEMLSYLALHRHEPVTGDRLRTRVLTHADVDASTRTLANTASALRRSLGADDQGPRLHAVTSSGLYVTHGVSSDVEAFASLVGRARQLPVADAAPLARRALALVTGEPLASALRGFEWFLAEGHGARLARDGEWAALALHHDALSHGQYELAFWALQRGLLIDPYSDALLEAIARVPRLREFGGDGAGPSKYQPVRAGRAVAMSWSFHGLSHEVTQ